MHHSSFHAPPAKVQDTEIEIRNWDATFRFFPFSGSFFVGAAYGSQGVVGKLTTDIETTSSGVTLKAPTTLRLEVESKTFTTQLCWFARWDGVVSGNDQRQRQFRDRGFRCDLSSRSLIRIH